MALDDELIEEAERAKRVFHLRDMTRLSRIKFQKKYGISSGTLQHWEAIDPGISVEGAKRLVKALAADIHVTPEWILHGIGSQPLFSKDLVTLTHSKDMSADCRSVQEKEEHYIREEVDAFKKNHQQALEHTVHDDAMEPFYQCGDVVIGSRYIGSDIDKLIERECIVFTKKGEVLLRHLKKGSLPNTYTLVTINPRTSVLEYAQHDVELMSAAPVMLIIKSRDDLL